MITLKGSLTKAACVLALSFPQALLAEGFTAGDVLEWGTSSQDSYFQTSVMMIAIVATQTGQHDHIAECIDGWYGGGDASQPKRSARILSVMESLPDYHPQALILAVIEKECGKFSD